MTGSGRYGPVAGHAEDFLDQGEGLADAVGPGRRDGLATLSDRSVIRVPLDGEPGAPQRLAHREGQPEQASSLVEFSI